MAMQRKPTSARKPPLPAEVFFGGADFDSPPPLGDTDRSRYVKVRTLEEAQAAEMNAWIEEAARVRGWRA